MRRLISLRKRTISLRKRAVLLVLTIAVPTVLSAATALAGTQVYCNWCSLYPQASPAVSATAYHIDNYMYSPNNWYVEIYMYNVDTNNKTCGASDIASSIYRACANYATSRCHLWGGGTGWVSVYCDTQYS